jgi:hypothetical protein
MGKVGQLISWFGLAITLTTLLPRPASADPIRLTVQFSVAGDPRDADFGRDTSSGSFSILTTLAAGQEGFDLVNGLGADAVSFTWAGTTWSAANADVLVLGFDPAGNVTRWSLNGVVPGDSGGTSFLVWPDFSVACGVCGTGRAGFNYTTPRSAQLGIFTGSVTSFSMQLSATPTPTPEPMSLLLVATGVAGLAAQRRKAGRVRS